MNVSGNQENSSVESRSGNQDSIRSQERKRCYRQLLNKIEDIEETESLGIQAVNELGEILQQANILDTEWCIKDRVDQTEETLLDCRVISSASNILKKCIEAVDVYTSSYEASDFTAKIIQHVANEDEFEETDILKLIDDARTVIPKVPDYNFVYGSYDLIKKPVPKQKKERVRVQKEQLQKKQPEKVTELTKEEESIEQIVKVLHDVLTVEYNNNDQQPIGYYDYIIDTTSYPDTIENMFYFSFLIRDGRARIDLDRHNKPIIMPVKKQDLKEFRNTGGVNTQIISHISMDIWEKFKKDGFLQKHKKRMY